MIDYIQNIVKDFNSLLSNLLAGNDFAIGAIIAGIMGFIYAFVRVVPKRLFLFLQKHSVTILQVDSTSNSYYLLSKYLYDRGLSDNSRTIQLINGVDGYSATQKSIGFGNHLFFFNKIPLYVNSTRRDTTGSKPIYTLTLTKLGRSHKLFDNMISSFQTIYEDPNKTKYWKYNFSGSNFIGEQFKRKIDKVFLDESIKTTLLNTLDKFVEKENWYIENNLPYQLGILLYGEPGTGKTSLAKAIAGYLNREVVLVETISSLSKACEYVKNSVIIAEEIDTFGMKKRNDQTETEKSELPVTESYEDLDDSYNDSYGEYSLGLILQALDGVISNHGRIVIMTTNHRNKLDKAFLRPGRVDLQLEIPYLNNNTFKTMMYNFYNKKEVDKYISNFKIKDRVSGAMVQADIVLEKSVKEIVENYNEVTK